MEKQGKFITFPPIQTLGGTEDWISLWTTDLLYVHPEVKPKLGSWFLDFALFQGSVF